MQAPGFWGNPPGAPGPMARALAPLSWVWRLETARRLRSGPWERMPIPVVCVGNLTVGGTGKTPTVTALLSRLSERGIAAHALYRGHKGREEGPLRVDPNGHGPEDVGDEALLATGFGPTWVARDRAAGIRAMAAAGAAVAILDDGFQNPGVGKDLSLLVVDAETGFGNGRILPAGPLREPVESGLARADMLLSLGPRGAQESLEKRWPQVAVLPRLRGRLLPLATGMKWQGLRAIAFAGIGRPEKFFATLEGQGALLLRRHAFSDHQSYPRPMLQRLLAEAESLGAQLVTTEKDAVRLPPDIRPKVLALPVRLELEDWQPLDEALEQVLDQSSP